MVISDQRHFSIVGGKYVITLPYNKFQLNIDTFSSSFQIKVNYKNVNDVMYLIDENVKSCGDQSKDIIIGSNTNLKGCLLIQSIKAAPNQGISGTIKFSNYKRAYYTNTGPRKYDQT